MKLYYSTSFTLANDEAVLSDRYQKIAAFQGFVVPEPAVGPMIMVCAWCPDKALADRYAHRAGYRVTHTICAECAAKAAKGGQVIAAATTESCP